MTNIKLSRKKKKKFLRQDAHKIKRLKKIWRKPKGMDNKMRLGLKGHRRGPAIGYGKPKYMKGLVGGLKKVLVNNVKDLEKITENDGIIISSKIGLKKRITILNKIKQLKLKVLNIDIEKFLKKAEERLKKKGEKPLEKPSSKEDIKVEVKEEKKKEPVKEEKKKKEVKEPKSKKITKKDSKEKTN